jgi:outer membrane protein assembly factor BamB
MGRRLYASPADPSGALQAFDLPTGRRDPGFHPQLSGSNLAGAAGRLFVLVGRHSVAALDSHGLRYRRFHLRTSGRGGILALVATPTRLYVGGGFKGVNGVRRPNLAAVDARTGRVIRTFRPSRRLSLVEYLYVHGVRLYVTGDFYTRVGGQRLRGFALLNARSGRLARSFNPPSNNASSPTVVRDTGARVYVLNDDFLSTLDRRTGRDLLDRSLSDTSVLDSFLSTMVIADGRAYLGGSLDQDTALASAPAVPPHLLQVRQR